MQYFILLIKSSKLLNMNLISIVIDIAFFDYESLFGKINIFNIKIIIFILLIYK